ncbi:MAG: hypothetical protein U1U88_001371 [Lawsonella clevelandensis]
MAAQIMVTELATGTLQALVDGTWITAWRTGAVAAHSALLFGNADPLHGEFTDVQRVGVVGLGNTAAACLHVLAEARPERLFEVTVLEYKDQHERFAERFGEFPNVRMRSVADMRELVGEKDVVVSAASHFDGDQCEPGWFAPGTTVIPIFKVGFNNLTPCSDLVFVDDVEGIRGGLEARILRIRWRLPRWCGVSIRDGQRRSSALCAITWGLRYTTFIGRRVCWI